MKKESAGEKHGIPRPSVAAEFERLVDDARQAARTTGVLPGDPTHPVLESFILMIRFMGCRTDQSDRTLAEASQRVVDALAQARTTANAEQRRFETSLAAARARTIADVSQAIAKSAEAALTKRVSIFQWRTVASTAAALVIVVVASLAGGYEWGSWITRSQLEQTKDELNAFSRLNPADSHRWAGLMLFNDNIKPDFDRCAETGGYDKGGRKACNFSFWIQ